MDAIAIANAVLAAIQMGEKIAPIAIQGISDAKTFAETLWKSITGMAPTEADSATINALIISLTGRLEVPLPPAQPGDPDYVPPAV